MADTVDLVFKPFRDVMAFGNVAIQNAGTSEPAMLKAGTALVRAGERAIQLIEPHCQRLTDEYGYSFHDALKSNDDIANYRTQLSMLLFDFGDCVELDNFDPDRFTELQALSRRAAVSISEILVRMKLDVPDDASVSTMSRHTSTANGTSYRYSNQSYGGLSVGGYGSPMLGPTSNPTLYTPSSAPSYATSNNSLSRPNSRVDSLDGRSDTQRDEPFMPCPDVPPPPPPIPSANPWDPRSSSLPAATDNPLRLSDFDITRRAPVDRADSLADAVSPLDRSRRFSSALSQTSADERSRPTSQASVQSGNSSAKYNLFPNFASNRPRAPTMGTNVADSIPEEAAVQHEAPRSSSPTLGQSTQVRQPSYALSRSPVAFERLSTSRILHDPEEQAGLEVVPMQPSIPSPYSGSLVMRDDDGLIPVESEAAPQAAPQYMSVQNCNISTMSSFYLNKGFCDGAKEVTRGGIGVKKTKKPVGLTTAATVARCTSCMCELNFKEIETDVCKQDAGNHSKAGISYRLRFLQKSHIAAKRVDDVMYGCIFCVKLGRTIDESDATVFFTPKALFEHLNRHPRPLPEVDGVTVVDGHDLPLHLRNDYDLHFKNPWEPHPALAHAAEIAQLPSATAREPARRLYGQRLLFDRTAALELAQGARVTGIKWPSKYNGEWAMGWHDGQYASVPTELLRMDPPPNHLIKMAGSSLVQGRARWKFMPRDKDKERADWLKFDKNELITNISWVYFEHWCWSGTNEKGKWGIFPQAFMDNNTVSEPTSSSRASSLSFEKSKSLGIKWPRRKTASVRVPSNSAPVGPRMHVQ